MFAALRQSLHRLSRQGRSAVGARTSAVRMQFEPLESRCMLSVAPTSGGLLEDSALGSTDFNDVAVIVALGTAGGQSSGFGSLIIESPGIFVPPFEQMPQLPDEFPGGDSAHGDWPEGLPWGFEPEPELQPDDSQGTSGAGGYVDIGVPDFTTPSDLFVDEAENQEADEVRHMLSSLNYLPPDLYSDLSGESNNLGSTGLTNPMPGELHLQATVPSQARAESVREDAPVVDEVAPTDREQSKDHDSEGGMTSLVHTELVEESEGEDAFAQDRERLTEVPVQMDKAHGKIQAFEVSAGDGESPPAPRLEHGTYLIPRSEVALELTSVPDMEPLPEVIPQLNPPASESQGIQETLVEDVQPHPGTDEGASRPLHVAIAAFVAVAVHVVRAIHTREPEEDGPTKDRRRFNGSNS